MTKKWALTVDERSDEAYYTVKPLTPNKLGVVSIAKFFRPQEPVKYTIFFDGIDNDLKKEIIEKYNTNIWKANGKSYFAVYLHDATNVNISQAQSLIDLLHQHEPLTEIIERLVDIFKLPNSPRATILTKMNNAITSFAMDDFLLAAEELMTSGYLREYWQISKSLLNIVDNKDIELLLKEADTEVLSQELIMLLNNIKNKRNNFLTNIQDTLKKYITVYVQYLEKNKESDFEISWETVDYLQKIFGINDTIVTGNDLFNIYTSISKNHTNYREAQHRAFDLLMTQPHPTEETEKIHWLEEKLSLALNSGQTRLAAYLFNELCANGTFSPLVEDIEGKAETFLTLATQIRALNTKVAMYQKITKTPSASTTPSSFWPKPDNPEMTVHQSVAKNPENYKSKGSSLD